MLFSRKGIQVDYIDYIFYAWFWVKKYRILCPYLL